MKDIHDHSEMVEIWEKVAELTLIRWDLSLIRLCFLNLGQFDPSHFKKNESNINITLCNCKQLTQSMLKVKKMLT